MNEAVAALRQEVARSYERSETLSKENDRLRALVTSLQRDLGKNRAENKTLRNQIRALERRLHEIGPSPPDTAEQPETAEPRVLPQPSTRRAAPSRPASPPAPPEDEEPADSAGGDFVEPTPAG
jgi:chromosome segregation ATPase